MTPKRLGIVFVSAFSGGLMGRHLLPPQIYPERRTQTCPQCKHQHNTGKAFCSAECCKEYRATKREGASK